MNDSTSRNSDLSKTQLTASKIISELGDNAYGVTVQEKLFLKTGIEHSTGEVYVLLRSLEDQELTASALGDATEERGGKRKRLYKLTEKGENEIKDC
jgi:DNA-binding PadR family transcriptional regulator